MHDEYEASVPPQPTAAAKTRRARRSLLRGAAVALGAAAAARLATSEAQPVPELLKDTINPLHTYTGLEYYGTDSKDVPWAVFNRIGPSPKRAIVGYVGVDAPPAALGDEGVAGHADTGIGVRAGSKSGTGAYVTSDGGIALQVNAGPQALALGVNGDVRFSSAGLAKFRKGQSSAVVSGVRTPDGCKVLVTLMQNPGPDNGLKYVKRTSDTGFTVYLQKAVGGAVSFAYFVVL